MFRSRASTMLLRLTKRQHALLELVLKPVRIFLSKTAIQTYLTSALVVISGVILLCFAVAAYILFYWFYIPRIGFERTIHLQFDALHNTADSHLGHCQSTCSFPYGTVSLTPDVVSNQRYDVAIEMLLPRTPENVEAGNFMVDVSLRAPEAKGAAGGILEAVKDGVLPASADAAGVLARSRRPGILHYRTRLVDLIYKATELHWYLLGVRQEAEKVRIAVFEEISFDKGWKNVPASLHVEVQSATRMQFYGAKALFRARFRGLRWLMYNHRLLSATLFVGAFWVTELLFAGLAWIVIVMVMNDPAKVKAGEVHEVAERIKEESADEEKPLLSDTERTFPTLSGQQPLHYRPPEIKQEEEPSALQGLPRAELEADDEDEDADTFIDSGIGTSMESGPGRSGSMRQRRGRPSSRQGLR